VGKPKERSGGSLTQVNPAPQPVPSAGSPPAAQPEPRPSPARAPAPASDVAADFLSIATGLEDQIARMLNLRSALERDLAETREHLREKSEAYAKLEGEVIELRKQAQWVESLRSDVAFAEEERNDAVRRLGEAERKTARLEREHEAVLGRLGANERDVEALRAENTTLQAKVLNLTDEVRDLAKQSASAEAARDELRRELDAKRAEVGELRGQVEVARSAMNLGRQEVKDLQGRVEVQEEKFQVLLEAKQKCDREIEALEATKEALRVMRTRLRGADAPE